MTVDPLVAPRADGGTGPWSGVWIAEDIELIAHGVRTGNWIDGTLGIAAAGLDGLALVSDPAGALLQYGVAWLIEHVQPLSEALDWLAGDPAQIAAHAQTWRNVSTALTTDADNLARSARQDVAEWSGAAAGAYRTWLARREQSLRALARASETTALITEAAGALIGTVRMMVRDAIATVVSRLMVYAGELIATAGLAAPLVAEQAATLCASWAARIARWLRSLIGSLRTLMSESARLGQLIEQIKRWLGRDGGGPARREPPGKPMPQRSRYDGMSPADLIADRGAHIGRPGSGQRVREVETVAELQDYFDALTRSGYTDITPPGFHGRMVQLPDGTIVNWRTWSRTTGQSPTVDVNPGPLRFKVHVNPHGW